MPTGTTVENNFQRGLITEATGVNFPENAVTETYNCEFDSDGSVYRRLGFDFEVDFETKEIDRSGAALSSYLWKNVAGNGDVSVYVLQVGDTLHFYETNNVGSFSLGEVADTVTLTPVTGAPIADTVEAQYSDGNGYLIVTHPYCDPIRIEYDIDAHTATDVTITIQIRDLEGVDDGLATDNRPTTTFASMDEDHEYNLKNQGWTVPSLTAWDTAQTTMPSNADVMWRFKDADDDLDFTTASIDRITLGNSPAPKGHFIMDLADQDRDSVASTSGVPSTTTGFQRPSTSAFFAGRVFYAGINHVGFNSNIYFTQILERLDQYGAAYQVNDPTSEDLFDILPSDGGLIRIPEAGTITKLMVVPGGLCVFAANGVWYITGSTGLGFTAIDYVVIKIANINVLSAASFVNVAGFPSWWNADGIYIMTGGQNLPAIQSLTDDSIKKFYDNIPLVSKRFARGLYLPVDGVIKWIYRSTATNEIEQTYEFDRVLNLEVKSAKAFYPWTVDITNVKIHAIVDSDLNSKYIGVELVEDGGVTVTDGGEDVFVYTETGLQGLPVNKYLVSYGDPATATFTFADVRNEDYLDWVSFDDEGVDFESYFITGYKLKGGGIAKFQNNWVRIFSRIDMPVAYDYQAIWDYALTGSGTGRWSSNQRVVHDDLNYSTATRRLKVRGHGLAMQFRVSSVEGEAFDIVGWSAMQTANERP